MDDCNVSIVVLSHGPLAEGLVKSVTMLYGTEGLDNLYAVCLQPDEDAEAYKDRVEEVLNKAGKECLIFCDIYGGTPFNTILKLSKDRKIYAMTGVNLVMLLDALTKKYTYKAEEILDELSNTAKDSIVNVTKIIEERLER